MKYLIFIMLLTGIQAGEMKEKKIIDALNTFIYTMQNYSMEKSAKMIVPMLHPSLLDKDGDRLNPNIYISTFPKIHQGAQDIVYPVKIKKIKKMITFGRAKTYGKGEEYKVWLAEKSPDDSRTKTIGVWIESINKIKVTSIVGVGK